jgi:hypothetical protein
MAQVVPNSSSCFHIFLYGSIPEFLTYTIFRPETFSSAAAYSDGPLNAKT